MKLRGDALLVLEGDRHQVKSFRWAWVWQQSMLLWGGHDGTWNLEWLLQLLVATFGSSLKMVLLSVLYIWYHQVSCVDATVRNVISDEDSYDWWHQFGAHCTSSLFFVWCNMLAKRVLGGSFTSCLVPQQPIWSFLMKALWVTHPVSRKLLAVVSWAQVDQYISDHHYKQQWNTSLQEHTGSSIHCSDTPQTSSCTEAGRQGRNSRDSALHLSSLLLRHYGTTMAAVVRA